MKPEQKTEYLPRIEALLNGPPSRFVEADWRDWLFNHFRRVTSALMPEGGRHARLWNWFEALEPRQRARPHVEFWPRGGGKSETCELATTRLGCRLKKKFVLYVSGTQGQANKHVEEIRANFEALDYKPAVGKYGNQKGWKVDLLRIENGFNVLAVGLDAAASRGVKLDSVRPDLIILDDVDARHDTQETVDKKIKTITETILPSGGANCAILFVQNLIHDKSIASQLANNTADFLLDREQTEVEPAIFDLKYETYYNADGMPVFRITEGRPSWKGQDIAKCEAQMNAEGRASFLRERQQEVDIVEDGLWQRARDIEPFRYRLREGGQIEIKHGATWELITPHWLRIGVAIDPSWASKGDVAGIISGGIFQWCGQIHGCVFKDKSLRGSSSKWAQTAVSEYHEIKGDVLLGEGNFMGEMVKSTVGTVPGAPPVKIVHVSRGKLIRAEPIQKLSEDGRLHFPTTGTADAETECCSYKPGDESPGRMDALVILFSELMLDVQPTPAPRKAYSF